MISEQEVRKTIAEILNQENESGTEASWDSLCHLNILIALDGRLGGKLANIEDIRTKTSMDSMLAVLSEHGLLDEKVGA